MPSGFASGIDGNAVRAVPDPMAPVLIQVTGTAPAPTAAVAAPVGSRAVPSSSAATRKRWAALSSDGTG